MEISLRHFDMDYLDAGWKHVEEACGSDYSGCSYTRANFEWFREEYRDHADVAILYGEFFGYGIGYNPETADDRLREIIDALSDYPLVCEHTVSLVEARWIVDALESWALKDFRKAVERHHGEDLLDDVSEETLARIFDLCAELANEYWQSENCGMHIDVDRLVPHFQSAVSSMPVHA
jgi:hypothetical protein